jgi:hypothetical protein
MCNDLIYSKVKFFAPALIKVGITGCPGTRYNNEYHEKGMLRMFLLLETMDIQEVLWLEAALIDKWQLMKEIHPELRGACGNYLKGGDAAHKLWGPPYFCYCVVTNASQIYDILRERGVLPPRRPCSIPGWPPLCA